MSTLNVIGPLTNPNLTSPMLISFLILSILSISPTLDLIISSYRSNHSRLVAPRISPDPPLIRPVAPFTIPSMHRSRKPPPFGCSSTALLQASNVQISEAPPLGCSPAALLRPSALQSHKSPPFGYNPATLLRPSALMPPGPTSFGRNPT